MKTLITTQQFLYCALIFTTFLPLVGASGSQEIPDPTREEIEAIEKKSAQDPKGNSPLMLAIDANNINLAHYFIKHHPKQINKPNNKSNFPLFKAVSWNNWPIAKLLIDNGADVNQTKNDGDSALLDASLQNNHLIMVYLLDHGANINHKDKYNRNALFFALVYDTSKPNLKTAEILKGAGIDLNTYSEDSTPLLWAIEDAKNKVVEILIQLGADLNLPRKDNKLSPFQNSFALSKPNVEAARMLIQAGADINKTNIGHPSLFFLVDLIILSHHECDEEKEKARLEILQMMLNTRKIPQPILNQTLVLAANKHYIPAVDLLIRAGARAEHASREAQTLIANVTKGSIEKAKQAMPIVQDFFKEYYVEEADLPPGTIMDKNPEKTIIQKKHFPSGVTDIIGEYVVAPGYKVPTHQTEEEKKAKEEQKRK